MSYSEQADSITSWKNSRAGAWAGRGFHYQHLISTLILIRQWAGLEPSGFLVPEGFEDCVIELNDHDIWLQIKSRKDGTFSQNEAESYLDSVRVNAEKIKSGKKKQIAIILEKPRTGKTEVDIGNLFTDKSQSVLICSDPGEESVKIISEQIDTAEVIADSIVSDLYRRVAEASALNASLEFEQRKRISTTEVDRQIFERLEAADPSAIDRAMASGIIRPVDLVNPLSEPAFYQGVKVVPGHVTSGLVFDRPNDVKTTADALRTQRQALISGPSGAGKSALMWLSVRSLAAEIRWFQLTVNAAVSHADSIIRFLRARRPTEKNQIGLVFDDVGSVNGNLWNVLGRELREIPYVYLLGSVRQENTALITNQPDTAFIKISLDEKLAENVWHRLHSQEQTRWEHWREPFERSEGLMLEYVYILTQGRRFEAVIQEQIEQRQQEKRHDELAILRSSAVLCSYGAEVQVKKLLDLLNINPDKAQLALSRLIDEHLVRESSPGVLDGLHVLRSKALANAAHDDSVFLREDSIWKNLPAVTNDTLPTTIQLILEETENEDEGLAKLAQILGTNDDFNAWIAVITGLGLATVNRQVDLLIKMLEQHRVDRAHWSLASMFVDPQIDIPDLGEFEQWSCLRKAMHAFRALEKKDFRTLCLENLPEGSGFRDCTTLQEANKLLACLAPICGGESIRIDISPSFGENQHDIKQVVDLLSTAYLVEPDVAKSLVENFGGEQKLFNWFQHQTPWVKTPTVDPNGKHGRTVQCDWFYVSEDEQNDPHDTVVDICQSLIALSPKSEAAASDVVNSLGQLYTVGDYPVGHKNMPRRNIPAKVRVAWNVAFR